MERTETDYGVGSVAVWVNPIVFLDGANKMRPLFGVLIMNLRLLTMMLATAASALGLFVGGAQSVRADEAENRMPECMREQAFYDNAVLDLAKNRAPIGELIVPYAQMGDPRYPGSQGWQKWEVRQYSEDWSRANPGVKQEYKHVMHYLFNHKTGFFTQVKLKNSYQEGCTGKTVKVAANDVGDSAGGGEGKDGEGYAACNPGSVTVENTYLVWKVCGGGSESCESGVTHVGSEFVDMERGDCG